MTSSQYISFLNLSAEGLTQLTLKYRQRLQQGIKSDEMLFDLFSYTSGLSILRDYDTVDLENNVANVNIISPKEIRFVIDALKCIRVKYNVILNYADFLNIIPDNAIITEGGILIWTESEEYITIE